MGPPDSPDRNAWTRAALSVRGQVHRLPGGATVWRRGDCAYRPGHCRRRRRPVTASRPRLVDHLSGHRRVGHRVRVGTPAPAPSTRFRERVDVLGRRPAAVAAVPGRCNRVRDRCRVRRVELAVVPALADPSSMANPSETVNVRREVISEGLWWDVARLYGTAAPAVSRTPGLGDPSMGAIEWRRRWGSTAGPGWCRLVRLGVAVLLVRGRMPARR